MKLVAPASKSMVVCYMLALTRTQFLGGPAASPTREERIDDVVQFMQSRKFIALWIVAILLLVTGLERPALLESGMTEGAIWICLIGVALFICWLGALYDNNGK